MGTRGPAKKPAAVHKRAGTYRKDRHATPDVPSKTPPMPAGMPKAAADAWKRIVPTLERAGFLAEIDAEALRMLCEAIADYEAVLRQEPQRAFALYGRGYVKGKQGDLAGGNADMVKAKSIRSSIAEEYARYGLN